MKSLSEVARKGFYGFRGKCISHGLDELWEQIRKVDEAEAEARDYAEFYLSNFEKLKEDRIYLRAMQKKVNTFGEEIERYRGIFLNKCNDGKIIFEVGGRQLNINEASKLEPGSLTLRCSFCGTEVPYLKYPDWE